MFEKENKRGSVCYRSELLGGKVFDSYEELVAAEEAQEAEIAEKEAAKLARKEEAAAVEAAISARVEAEAEARKAKLAAYKAYLAACDASDKAVEALREAEAEKLKEFCEKHPEGFHTTIKIGDADYRYDYSSNRNEADFLDVFKRFWL